MYKNIFVILLGINLSCSVAFAGGDFVKDIKDSELSVSHVKESATLATKLVAKLKGKGLTDEQILSVLDQEVCEKELLDGQLDSSDIIPLVAGFCVGAILPFALFILIRDHLYPREEHSHASFSHYGYELYLGRSLTPEAAQHLRQLVSDLDGNCLDSPEDWYNYNDLVQGFRMRHPRRDTGDIILHRSYGYRSSSGFNTGREALNI